jgi:SNW domain-containing protein 1
MQQRLAEKEKANKEEHLRMLAQKAREGRAGGASTSTAATKPSTAALQSSLGQYGDSDSESRSESDKSEEEDSGDDEAARLRDKLRREKRQDREREMRMSNMGTEQRMKQLARSVSFHFHSRIG